MNNHIMSVLSNLYPYERRTRGQNSGDKNLQEKKEFLRKKLVVFFFIISITMTLQYVDKTAADFDINFFSRVDIRGV